MAIEVIMYVRILRRMGLEFPIANQLIKSATAPGALIAEGVEGESRVDMAHKYSIALKEARETEYWLEIVERTSKTVLSQHATISGLLNEVIAMLVTSIRTLRQKASPRVSPSANV